jgi:hypothetical protein
MGLLKSVVLGFAATHFVMIGAYAEYGPDSEQIRWLHADLSAVDRAITPWLIAIFHPPMYNTYIAHYKVRAINALAYSHLPFAHVQQHVPYTLQGESDQRPGSYPSSIHPCTTRTLHIHITR